MRFMEFRRGNSLGTLITHYKYLQGNDISEGSELFTISDDGRARGSDLDLRKGSLAGRKPGQQQPSVGRAPWGSPAFHADVVSHTPLDGPTPIPVLAGLRPARGLCGSSRPMCSSWRGGSG